MSTQDLPTVPEPDPQRRLWVAATGVMGGVAVVATAIPFVSTFAPSERAKAAGGPVEVDLSDLQPGAMKTAEWRGKPVWVVRRTTAMLAALQGHDTELADPTSARDQQPDGAERSCLHAQRCGLPLCYLYPSVPRSASATSRSTTTIASIGTACSR